MLLCAHPTVSISFDLKHRRSSLDFAQAAQPGGGVRPPSVTSVAASSGASGRSGSGGANAVAEAAAKAALRRIADPDAPERPAMPVRAYFKSCQERDGMGRAVRTHP